MSSVSFLFFLESDLSKVNKILGLTFFKAEKTLEDRKRFFFPFTVAVFVARCNAYNSRLFA